MRGGGLKHVLHDPNPRPKLLRSGSKHLVSMKVFYPINESTQETNKSRISPIMSQR